MVTALGGETGLLGDFIIERLIPTEDIFRPMQCRDIYSIQLILKERDTQRQASRKIYFSFERVNDPPCLRSDGIEASSFPGTARRESLGTFPTLFVSEERRSAREIDAVAAEERKPPPTWERLSHLALPRAPAQPGK